MTIRAKCIGSHVSVRFTGVVLSVHEHAINIAPVEHVPSRGFPLLSLIDRESDLTASSILLPTLPQDLTIGCGAVLSSGRLSLASRTADGNDLAITVLVSGAPEFSGHIPEPTARPTSLSLTPGLRKELVDLMSCALRRLGIPGGFLSLATDDLPDSPFAKHARSTIAGKGGDKMSLEECLANLVGLGPGFTPSGDDFVCGALAASRLLARSVTPEPISKRLHSTTAGGATLLLLALDGSFPKYLCDFVASIWEAIGPDGTLETTSSGRAARHPDKATAHVSRAVAVAVTHGETSGTDTLAGFHWGLGIDLFQ